MVQLVPNVEFRLNIHTNHQHTYHITSLHEYCLVRAPEIKLLAKVLPSPIVSAVVCVPKERQDGEGQLELELLCTVQGNS